MKTLTLFRAYDATGAEIAFLVGETRFATSPEEAEQIRKKKSRKLRQKRTFRNALTKRLQEQEEELALLNAYSSDTAVFLHIHGFNYDKWHENYLKEST